MASVGTRGRIVVLNGAPRSGKSSIAAAIQKTFPGVWMNLGVDSFKSMTPERYQPGIGLRPGGERPDLEPLVVLLYRAMYAAIAQHSRLGLNVVVDVGHHDAYSIPRAILPRCARQLRGLPVWFVSVRCPIDVVIARRRETWHQSFACEDSAIQAVRIWQQVVHDPGIYDLEVDTSVLSSQECADAILRHLKAGPKPVAFHRLSSMATEA
jgi:chloramphenicol 3-O phosphotransferase